MPAYDINRFNLYCFFSGLQLFSSITLLKCTPLDSSRRVVYFANRIKANWAASNSLEQDECRKVGSDYVHLFFFFFSFVFYALDSPVGLLYAIVGFTNSLLYTVSTLCPLTVLSPLDLINTTITNYIRLSLSETVRS